MSLFGRLRSRARRASSTSAPSSAAPPVAPERGFVAIGDLHGCLAPLEQLLAAIEANGLGDLPLVFVGDYVDRGPDSLGVLKRLNALERARGADCVCLLGNHEEMMLDFLADPQAGRRWLVHGGLETLASCGLDPVGRDADAAAWEGLRVRLQAVLGAELIAWLKARPAIWHSGNVAVVHAGADPAERLSLQQHKHLVWGHRDFLAVPRRDGRWVVHGHTIVEAPEMRDGRIAIDTGAYASGRLSAALVMPGQVSFLTL
jgi:serine/threonine protein phosphatase 1